METSYIIILVLLGALALSWGALGIWIWILKLDAKKAEQTICFLEKEVTHLKRFAHLSEEADRIEGLSSDEKLALFNRNLSDA